MDEENTGGRPTRARLTFEAHHEEDEGRRIGAGVQLISRLEADHDHRSLIKAYGDPELHPDVKEWVLNAILRVLVDLPGIEDDPEPFYDCAQHEALPDSFRLELGLRLSDFCLGTLDDRTLSKMARDYLFSEDVRDRAGVNLLEILLDRGDETALWAVVDDGKYPYRTRLQALEVASELLVDRGDYARLVDLADRPYPAGFKMALSEASESAQAVALQMASEQEQAALLEEFERDSRLSDRPPPVREGHDFDLSERPSSLGSRALSAEHLEAVRVFTAKSPSDRPLPPPIKLPLKGKGKG